MENKNVKSSAIETFKSFFYFSVVINIIGFFSWALYQISAKEIELLPSISLAGGLCIWWLIILISLTPKILTKLFEVAINDVLQKKYQESLTKIFLDQQKIQNSKQYEKQLNDFDINGPKH